MTDADKQVVRDLIAEWMSENGASVDNSEEVETVTDLSEITDALTLPVATMSEGVSTGYKQTTLEALTNYIIAHVDDETIEAAIEEAGLPAFVEVNDVTAE